MTPAERQKLWRDRRKAGLVRVEIWVPAADFMDAKTLSALDPHADDIARLRFALELCPPDKPQMTDRDFRDAVNAWWRLYARPALKQTRGKKTPEEQK